MKEHAFSLQAKSLQKVPKIDLEEFRINTFPLFWKNSFDYFRAYRKVIISGILKTHSYLNHQLFFDCLEIIISNLSSLPQHDLIFSNDFFAQFSEIFLCLLNYKTSQNVRESASQLLLKILPFFPDSSFSKIKNVLHISLCFHIFTKDAGKNQYFFEEFTPGEPLDTAKQIGIKKKMF
jgi:hypothetical protein